MHVVQLLHATKTKLETIASSKIRKEEKLFYYSCLKKQYSLVQIRQAVTFFKTKYSKKKK